MKVFAFTKYHPEGPSSRLRFYQFEDLLAKEGVEVEFHPLLPDGYVKALFESRKTSWVKIAWAYLKRFFQVLRLPKGSVVWLEKEFFPYLPKTLEALMIWKCNVVIVDYDDATFHLYDSHNNALIRRVLGSKIDSVMRWSDTVIVGNSYIKERAVKAGSKKVIVIPTVISKERYSIPPAFGHKLVLGWIGSPITQKFLVPLKETLEKLADELDFDIHLLGASPDFWSHRRVKIIEWQDSTEVKEIQRFSIGIMPLTDSPFERGKCGYKLIQYLACGIPVIASPVGINCEIVVDQIGRLASSESDWHMAISDLIDTINKSDRKKLSESVRERFLAEYEVAVFARKFLEVLRSNKKLVGNV